MNSSRPDFRNSAIGKFGYSLLPLMADVSLLVLSLLAGYALRFNFSIPRSHLALLATVLPFAVAVELLSLYLWGCFRLVWRYCSATDIPRFVGAFSASSLFFLILRFSFPLTASGLYPPISVVFINGVVAFCALLGARLFSRILAYSKQRFPRMGEKRVLIVGAGASGNALAYALCHDRLRARQVLGFLDDSPARLHKLIQGRPVLGTLADADKFLAVFGIDEVIVPVGLLAREKLQPLFSAVEKARAKLLIAPDYSSLLDRSYRAGELRDAEIADLLRRPEISLSDDASHRELFAGKRVMVTGAGGSIGSEIVKQVFQASPAQLVLVERSENALFQINRALAQANAPKDVVFPYVADVADESRMRHVFQRHLPEIVIHAAAHKHVPLMEGNVCEAIANNVLATRRLGEMCCEYGVERFILLSSDKAVHPSSVMGATKRAGEILLQDLNGSSKTIFLAVRFGNVLGSSGSVVPIFREQIQAGGPVTVTHPDMVRYFMTIPEAVHLTLEAASFAHGGEIFILDMGEPVKIVDLAEEMIRLSGNRPEVDIPITFIGVRPGEKFMEELASPEENVRPTSHPQISCGKLTRRSHEEVVRALSEFASVSEEGDDEKARIVLMGFVKGKEGVA